MMNTILAKKLKMEQEFVGSTRVPVTLVEAGPCVVTQIKDMSSDGYWAIQLGFGSKKASKLTKPMQGHLRGATKGKLAPRFLREVRLSEKPDFKVGDEITLDQVFSAGDVISVTATSKGKGFAGGMKRWGFGGGPRTHGQSDRQRSPGSIGQGTDPGRVHKGKKMAGRMGNEQVTIKNLRVVKLDKDNNLLYISGPIPGNRNSLVIIRKIAVGKVSDLIEEKQEVVQQAEEKPKEEANEQA